MSGELVGGLLIGSLVVVGILWLILEIKTLRDSTPSNHITAVIRVAVKAQPGPFILFALALGFLFGHLFWQ